MIKPKAEIISGLMAITGPKIANFLEEDSISPQALEWVLGLAGVSCGFATGISTEARISFLTSLGFAALGLASLELAHVGVLDLTAARYFAIASFSAGVGNGVGMLARLSGLIRL